MLSIKNKHVQQWSTHIHSDRHTIFREKYTHTSAYTIETHDDKKMMEQVNGLKAFSVNDRWAWFVVLLFRNPHLLEGRQRRQDRSSDPHRVFALRWSDDLDLHRWGSQRGDLLLHAISNTWIHGCTYSQNRSSPPNIFHVVHLPPERTVLAYKSLRMSISHFMIEL